jgi:hypothetical protein
VGKKHCKAIGGACHIDRDGYYIVTNACMAFGVLFLVAFIWPSARKLQGEHPERKPIPPQVVDQLSDGVSPTALPTSAWRLKQL